MVNIIEIDEYEIDKNESNKKEIIDNWSLMAIVRESDRKYKLRLAAEGTSTFAATAATSNTILSPTPIPGHFQTSHSYPPQISFFNEFVQPNNSGGYPFPAAVGGARDVFTNTPVANTTTTTTTTTPIPSNLETNQSYPQMSFFNEFVQQNNSVGYQLPAAAVDFMLTNTPVATATTTSIPGNLETNQSYPQMSFSNEFVQQNNSVGYQLPAIAGARDRSPAADFMLTNTPVATAAATTTTPIPSNLETNQSYPQMSLFNDFVQQNNSIGYQFTAIEGARDHAPAAADFLARVGSSSIPIIDALRRAAFENEIREMYRPLSVPSPTPPPPPPPPRPRPHPHPHPHPHPRPSPPHEITTITDNEPHVVESSRGMSSNQTVRRRNSKQPRNVPRRDYRINMMMHSSSAVKDIGAIYESVNKKAKVENELRTVLKTTFDEIEKVDKWTWRKYGQKPIKHTPYPRSYYKCSSMLGCRAKKIVEQCSDNPKIYSFTYIHYHYHHYPTSRYDSGHRVRLSYADLPPVIESSPPISSIIPDPTRPVSRPEPGWAGNGFKTVDAAVEHADVHGGGGGDGDAAVDNASFGNIPSLIMDDEDYYDFGNILIPNPDWDVFSSIELFGGGDNNIASTSASANASGSASTSNGSVNNENVSMFGLTRDGMWRPN